MTAAEHVDQVVAAAAPGRIRQRRTKGWRKPAGVVCLGRGTRWVNPWAVDDPHAPAGATRAEVVGLFRDWLLYRDPGMQDVYRVGRHSYDRRWMTTQLAAGALRGKTLACWCPVDDQPCHAEVLLQLGNAENVGRMTHAEPMTPDDPAGGDHDA
ncbi:MAG TPA: DUF4326 domain-containing protein [Kribbellaceae bacterium]|jgi:hypothetical protein